MKYEKGKKGTDRYEYIDKTEKEIELLSTKKELDNKGSKLIAITISVILLGMTFIGCVTAIIYKWMCNGGVC